MKEHEDVGIPTIASIDVLKRAVSDWGNTQQIDMAIEEMSELTKALLKHRRAEKSPEVLDYEKTFQNIAEEMADVYIMLSQLSIIFKNSELVQVHINQKCDRLEKIIKT